MLVDPRGHRGGFFGASPPDAFIWGRGGRRMSQDDIALQRRLAAQQMQTGADFSPVQHWSQGLARVANGVVGGLRMNKAEDAAAEQSEAQAAILEALTGGATLEGGGDAVSAALLDPELRDFGMAAWKARQPSPAEDKDAVIRLSRIANDPTQPEWLRNDAAAQIEVLNNPLSVITNSAGTQILPRSELLNGGAPGVLPDTLPPDFDFGEPQMPAPVDPALEQFKSVYGPEEGERRYNALIGMGGF